MNPSLTTTLNELNNLPKYELAGSPTAAAVHVNQRNNFNVVEPFIRIAKALINGLVTAVTDQGNKLAELEGKTMRLQTQIDYINTKIAELSAPDEGEGESLAPPAKSKSK